MTDLREKVLQQVRACLSWRVDDLNRPATMKRHAELAQQATDAIMALVQPVVTDEMYEAALDAYSRELQEHEWGRLDREPKPMRAALTAALPHAVTRNDVLEELAVEAERDNALIGMPPPGQGERGYWLKAADWLRSRKGGE